MEKMSNLDEPMSPGVVIAWWERLRDQGADTRHVAEPSGQYGDATLLLSLGSEGEPAMIAEADPRDRLAADLGGRNITVLMRTISLNGRQQRCIELVCTERTLESVFAELVVDVMRRISSGMSSSHAVERALEEFRRLLEREPPNTIGREEAIALAGELLVLKRMTRIGPRAWETWNGPLGEVHDFHHGGSAIEVKTTVHAGEALMEIHGLEQLQAPAGGLHLLQVVLVPDPAGVVTVPALAEGIRKLVDDETGFVHRLEEAGYSESEAARWEAHRFSTSRVSCFEVGHGFPKVTYEEIVGGTLPSGVTTIRYAIALSAIRQWKLPDAAVDNILAEFVGHHGQG